MRRNDYKPQEMFTGKQRDEQMEKLSKSVDNIRMKEPDQADMMRTVKQRAPYKKQGDDQESVGELKEPGKEPDKPEQIVHPIQSKPEQIVHPIQNMQYVKEQQAPPPQPPPPPPQLIPQDTFSHIYIPPRVTDKESSNRPGIIPMSKINDHTMFGSQHLTTSHPGYLNSGGAARYTGSTPQQTHRHTLPMNMASVQFPRTQTPVSSNYTSLGSLSTPNFAQNTLTSSFTNNQPPFISQGHMSNQEQQLLAFQLLQQNSPFQQMMLPQNYQMPGLELMPQALHSTTGLHSDRKSVV